MRHALLRLTFLALLSSPWHLAAPAAAEDLEFCELGLDASDEGDYPRAVDYFTRCIETGALSDETLAAAHYDRGMALIRDRQFARAIPDMDLVIGLEPTNSRALNGRGIALTETGQYARAIADYDESLRLDPNHVQAYYNRGVTYARMGEIERARNDILTEWNVAPGEIVADQQTMADMGFYRGPIDGRADAATLDALEAWLRAGAPEPQ